MKAIIVGAGIGGLCSALCLMAKGWQVHILEQSSEITEIGAGIQLSPNAMQVMQKLGLDDAIKARAFRPIANQMRDGISGNVIMSSPMGSPMERQYGAPYLHIHRAALINILYDALLIQNPHAIQLQSPITHYQQNDTAITVYRADGVEISGDILIGADGIKSIIAKQILGEDYRAPRFTGNMAWRATVPISRLGRHIPPPAASIWIGDGKHAVTYLLGQKDQEPLANFVGVVEGDWDDEAWDIIGNRDDAMADFNGWHPIIETLINHADKHHKWALYDRAAWPYWHDGRAVILGDAAHAMLPFLAQGAAMAIEDSYVLAQILSQYNIIDALPKFYERRIKRTTKMQNEARNQMKIFHNNDAKRQSSLWLADKLTRHKAANMKMDWIYSHDVTRI